MSVICILQSYQLNKDCIKNKTVKEFPRNGKETIFGDFVDKQMHGIAELTRLSFINSFHEFFCNHCNNLLK